MYRERHALFVDREIKSILTSEECAHLVMKRLVALQYAIDPTTGDLIDTQDGSVVVSATDTSNTGQTPQELANLGYTPNQIAYLAGSSSTPVSPPASAGAPTVSGQTTIQGNATTSPANLASALGSLATSIATAVNGPTVINPRTGQPYTQAQLQQIAAAQPTSVLGLNLGGGILPLLLIGLVIFLVVEAGKK